MDAEAQGHNPQDVRDQLRNGNGEETGQSITITISPVDSEDPHNEISMGSHIVRRLSCEAVSIARRVSIPERPVSSMSHCPANENHSNHLFFFQTLTTTTANKTTKGDSKCGTESNFPNLGISKKQKVSSYILSRSEKAVSIHIYFSVSV